MQTRIRELPAQAVTVGGLAVLGGVTLRRLGIEFERAWLRSYEGPLLGEPTAEHAILTPSAPSTDTSAKDGEHRRWVSPQQSRIAPAVRRGSRTQAAAEAA
jgi:hypothetical protein